MIVPGQTWVVAPYRGSVEIGKVTRSSPGPDGDDVLRVEFVAPGEFVLVPRSLIHFVLGPGDGEDPEGWP